MAGRLSMSAMRWEWQRLLARPAALGWLALLGVAGASAAAFDSWQIWWQAQHAPVVVEARTKPHAAVDEGTVARQALQEFYGTLPAANRLAEPTLAILQLGERHHLQFTEGEYHRSALADAPVTTEDIALPVSGNPADIQAFISDALRHQPALTYTGLTFERESSDSSVIKARIHFLLVARAAP